MKKFILFILVLAAGVALGIYYQKQAGSQKTETQVETDAKHVVADVKSDAQKTDSVAAQAKADVQAGVVKSEEIATNVEAHIKAGAQKISEATTNVLGEIKEKLP